ncbi:MAG: hypothetical protein DRG78_00250 [Epsilonproteobacteria bacterium]|nr:MAG: hypothetical protein DRG78_00250 [Campylobacterota bacterium]
MALTVSDESFEDSVRIIANAPNNSFSSLMQLISQQKQLLSNVPVYELLTEKTLSRFTKAEQDQLKLLGT